MPDSSVNPIRTGPLADSYYEKGYLFPVNVLTEDEAVSYREALESLEARLGDLKIGNKSQLNFPHLIFKFANELARHPKILDVVEELIGPDILLWGSTFFIKEPQTESYVSWHQDMKYWGLDDTDGQVSAWVALSDVKQIHGCMQFVPESHKGAMVDHNDTFAEDNFLTRGQEAQVEIEENDLVHCELDPGQVSFHHGKLLHASAPHRSDDRRIGFAIQFIAPHVKQTIAQKDYAVLVRGEDRFGHFELVQPPSSDLSPESLALHAKVMGYQNEALYDGAEDADR